MNEPPVNLLSLGALSVSISLSHHLLIPDLWTDGGGIRGVSELTILDEIMRRVQDRQRLPELPKPCDYFHLIGGTSTGG